MKPVPGYEGQYSATYDGRIYSHLSGKFLKPKIHWNGYLAVCLCHGKHDHKDALVHRIVCRTFNGPHPDDRNFVNHIDGNKANNSANNLEWCSREENAQHAWDNGLMRGNLAHLKLLNESRKRPVIGTFPDGSTVSFPSVVAARKAGYSSVSHALSHERRTACGATWRYA